MNRTRAMTHGMVLAKPMVTEGKIKKVDGDALERLLKAKTIDLANKG